MKFNDYIESIQNDSSACLYAKDWHLQKLGLLFPQVTGKIIFRWFLRLFPNCNVYNLPSYFSTDWLNEYFDHKNDPIQLDYRFCYIGTPGTWLEKMCLEILISWVNRHFFIRTPYHADVFRSYSWSANICGRKLWYLTPPGIETKFLSAGDYDYSFSNDLRLFEQNDVYESFPKSVIKCVQYPGEIMFVPSNWFHQVHNLVRWKFSSTIHFLISFNVLVGYCNFHQP